MANLIERVVEPRKLLLAWQAPDSRDSDRFRWVVAILDCSGNNCTLRYLRDDAEFRSLNAGRELADLHALGYEGFPAFNMKRLVHDRGVLRTFMRRLPPRSRSDFQEYEQQFRLSPRLEFSDVALLGLTEAKLPSDGFSLVDPLDPDATHCDLMLEIAGYRYHAPAENAGMRIGMPVELQPEPENPHDTNAVRIDAGRRKLGYVNRLQAPTFRRWLETRRVTCVIERLNGRPGHPRAFVFVRVRPLVLKAAA